MQCMKCDFHVHSSVSDGSDTISQLIEKAQERGLYAIAVTEHDTLSHIGKIPANADVHVAAGIEISAVHKQTGIKAHILGYNIVKTEIVNELVSPVLEARNRLSEKQAEIITKLGYNIEVSLLSRADGKYLYKQHIMAWLCETGQVSEMFGAFYKKIFKNGGVCDLEIDYPSVFDAVSAIKEAGGLAVLAHPGQQSNFWLIPKLTDVGLDGLELNHPSNTESDKEKIHDYAKKHNLFLTGGSDYHGMFSNHPYKIGDILSEKSGIKAILGSFVRNP